MTTSKRELFECLYDRNSGRIFKDYVFENCRFESCGLSIANDPKLRTKIYNVHLSRCVVTGTTVYSAVLDNVVVDNLKTVGLLQCRGTAFRQVVLRGSIGRLMVGSEIAPGSASASQQRAFDAANEEFYQTVDWALDITEAQFEEADLRGVPGKLVRRDVATQVLITRECLESSSWSNIDLNGTPYRISINLFLEGHLDANVLVAPKRHPKFAKYVGALNRLREAGFAE